MKTFEEYSFHPEMSRAMTMIRHYPIEQVERFTGIPDRFIKKMAKLTGNEIFIFSDTEKFDLSAPYFFESKIESRVPGESQEEMIARIQGAITSFQQNCGHEQFHVACSRCYQILGSEVTYYNRDQFLRLAKEIQHDLTVEDYDDPRNQILRVFIDRLQDNFYKVHATDTTDS